MLKFLGEKASVRKLRLFACASCERIEHFLSDARSRSAIAALRRAADNRADDNEIAREVEGARRAWASALRAVCVPVLGVEEYERTTNQLQTGPGVLEQIAKDDPAYNATYAVECAVRSADPQVVRAAARRSHVSPVELIALAADYAAYAVACEQCLAARPVERAAQCDLLRDLFENPFRPAALDSTWLLWNSGVVAKIAQAIYDERNGSDMPILADALEESGCTNTDVLNHCRQPGAHVRGCWVIDLLLGKS
jgi:hypothetical protein